jgi:uncharacterized protein
MKTTAHPVSLSERIHLLDMLRGLAIFGILMVNMQVFYQPMTLMMAGYQGSETTAGLISEIFIKVFFEGKFYVLFSMLFGYGFYIFMNKTTESGGSIVPVFRRRVFFLFLFGVLHVVLLWPGDILTFYAIFGLILLAFRKVSDRGLIKWAIWLALIPTIAVGLFAGFLFAMLQIPEVAAEMIPALRQQAIEMQAMLEHAAAVYATGSFGQITAMRISEYLTMLPGVIFFYPVVLAMFLLGFWAGRKGIIKNYQDHLPFFRKMARVGLLFGLPLSGLFAWAYLNSSPGMPTPVSFLSTIGHTFGGILLGLFYVSVMVLLTAKGKTGSLQKWLAPVGRMALTNYLLHSIVFTTVFYGYGFGFFGQINPPTGILLTVIMFVLQIPFSKWWLSRFQYGPFEWLWRSLTYLEWQPFMKKMPVVARAEHL